MAKKISQLTQATEVKSDDVTVIVQDGETKKLPLNMMVTKQDIENKKIAGLAKLDEIETTYENDTYTPTITVKNKSSVKTGEGDEVDYSANVMDGHVKSAILSGNTLVNYANGHVIGMYLSSGALGKYSYSIATTPKNLTYKKYTIIQPSKKANRIAFTIPNIKEQKINAITNGVFLLDLTNETEDLANQDLKLSVFDANGSASMSINEDMFMIVEGDYTNVDIPYFEGMQSVKMPVLTTTGKNLFDGELEFGSIDNDGNYISNSNIIRSKNLIKVNSSTDYILSNDLSYSFVVYEYDSNGNFIRTRGNSFTTTENTSFISFRFGTNQTDTNVKVQLEKGAQATEYEPYKSNILSTPEDLELRGIGDVKDTLDLMTGEVVECIGEIVLDGSENWSYHENLSTDALAVFSVYNDFGYLEWLGTGSILCDKFPITQERTTGSKPQEGIYDKDGWAGKNKIPLIINKDRLSSVSVEALKSWLANNQLKLQFKLQNKSIKTVDLMPSGTHPSTTPYCWKNGHIQLSSSGLLPNLEYSVVTSRAGQINQNATMIVKNDKRIFDLEILLAGGLVNTTYQALTLQNQVETGLSKVSLNSETEPDYLLYHMIMKLIEEKAYKLDDLTEKVSVFYLYEKLSDEQFETIYSELYPFVEDEIVEEPVVEELPEVVEDEVIM